MNMRLIIFLIIFCLVFGIIIFYNIFRRKITLQYSLMWFSYCILMLIVLISTPILDKVTSFLWFEVTSNMVFFFGFIILLVISFTLTKFLSLQKEKITTLTQEVGILKKELENYHEKN